MLPSLAFTKFKCLSGHFSTHIWEQKTAGRHEPLIGAVKKLQQPDVATLPDLRGGTLELQEHQGAGTFQDVEVKQKRFLPVT